MAESQSPLHDIAVASGAAAAEFVSPGGAVHMRELPFLGHLHLRGAPDDARFLSQVKAALGCALPLAPNTAVGGEAGDVLWLGPDEWWIVTAARERAKVLQSLEKAVAGMFASLIDQSSGHTVIRITGEGDGEPARNLLRSGCTMDMHPEYFPPGQCAQTIFAKTNITLLPAEDEQNRWRCDLIVRRSFADYLWRWLEEGAAGVDGGG